MNTQLSQRNPKIKFLIAGILLTLLAAGIGIGLSRAAAQRAAQAQGPATPLHPAFAMLDTDGAYVITSEKSVSTMNTCGQCHDTEFITSHSFHSDLGLAGIQAGLLSTDLFDPLTYRYLLPLSGSRTDLTDWIKQNADRLVGGGPGAAAQTLEMDCFLCHFPTPDNHARLAAIQAGEFDWANTATLQGTGLVEKTVDGWSWNPAAFDPEGKLLPQYITIQDPTNTNCAQCHGLVQVDTQTPLTLPACNNLSNSQTATSGQVNSPQKISESGVNLTNKDTLSRSWDIHTERQLACVDCHYSLNNPIYYQESAATRPAHLLFDPRRLDIREYLKSPDHNFARGQSAQYNVAPELKGTMRRCESCHDAATTHSSWLPYTQRHMDMVACEYCHIPQLYAPAIQTYDWTVLNLNDQPATSCRGVQGIGGSATDLVSGYQPVLMLRTNVDGKTTLAPFNLITTWYWVFDDVSGNTLPVPLLDLKSAWLTNGRYVPEVLSAFDANVDGALNASELVIDTQAKQELIAYRLAALGLKNLRIAGLVQPYSINHDVAGGEWAVKDCATCHSSNSRLTKSVELAAYTPGGVTPAFVDDTNVSVDGQIVTGADGALYYQPQTHAEGRYIFGHDRLPWVDWFGALFFLGVLAAVSVHGGFRVRAALRQSKQKLPLKKVYMYQAYERFWHWLQTTVIVLLLVTGLIIHRPDMFGIFSFRGVVTMHNVMWVLLALNAALSLFYHLTSRQIKQFIPRPYGFFNDAIVQARYYLRGIFKREPHPFEKTPGKKMNPLQQVTYLAILNVLLPLQGLTGILMWGVQKWPALAGKLGGLPFLAPFHTLIAWTFAAFIVGHVYLTTTGGPRTLDSIKAMVTGWDEVEVPERNG